MTQQSSARSTRSVPLLGSDVECSGVCEQESSARLTRSLPLLGSDVECSGVREQDSELASEAFGTGRFLRDPPTTFLNPIKQSKTAYAPHLPTLTNEAV